MSTTRYDREIEQYRSLMEVPSTFGEGFSWTSLVGALFIALLMVPGAMYMQLLAGQGVGPAAQWVTVILFIEVARRAHKRLKLPEIFILFYMAGAAMGGAMVMNQPMKGLLWFQFFRTSNAATGMGVAEHIPWWVAPSDRDVLAERNFFHPAWYAAIGLFVFRTVLGRINSTFLTYGLFRLASDIEKLPFPMAPIGAQGIAALAEQQTEETAQGRSREGNWRWRIFSIGGVLGLAFGAVYMALPAVTGALFDTPITILPIPFADWTPKTANILPAVATGISLNLGQFMLGMVLPFFAMVGSFVGFIITAILNPTLYNAGIIKSWSPGDDTVKTLFSANIDFYFSFTLGVAGALALVGFYQVFRSLRKRRKQIREQRDQRLSQETGPTVPEGRGDLPTWAIIGAYLFTSTAYIVVSGFLIDWHPGVMAVLFFFAFLYTPLISYVTARLEGMAGQVVQVPMVKEAAFILSGYSGDVDVWFLPVPVADYGRRTMFYRQAELTGTRFWSIWKTDLLLVPIIIVSSVLFSQFIWAMAPVPGPEYPFAERMWELWAANQCIIQSSTLGRFSAFEKAFRPDFLLSGLGFGVVLFAVLWMIRLPVMLVYGVVRGLNQTLPHVVIPQFIGALISRFYFERKMGLKWRQYVPVVAAGFACGMGLVTVLGVGVNFLAKAVIKIPF
ncbi:MAG: OPT/YSL family transporter [Phycisphaerae bacterium]|nr:OPT/YSL family transporter [Phycisphaerae bacterium]